MKAALRSFLARTGRILRDSWLVLGVTVAMLVLAEAAYRMEGAIRTSIRRAHASAGPANPLAAADWYPDYLHEYEETFHLHWQPYVYFRRRPFHGQYITVDSLGHRATPQHRGAGPPRRRVFFMGGSTMWGSYQRDDYTIPAEAARRLQAQDGSQGWTEVTNFGESGYVFTQEMLELILQLRTGNRPDVVVFYDGINDVAATVQSGRAGIPQNESNRVAEFAMGREVNGYSSGVLKDLKAIGALALAGFQKSELLQRLESFVRPVRPLLPADSAARSVVRIYIENVRMIETLARTYGFRPIYVWQPTLYSTRKRLTTFEEQLMASIRRDPFRRRVQDVHLAVAPLLDSAMATIAPEGFVEASALFSEDPLPIFVDELGHTSESAIPLIVDTFWSRLQAAVAGASPRRGISPSRP